MRQILIGFGAAILLLAAFGAAGQTSATGGGQADRGKQLAAYYGCGSCHEIPRLRGATGMVGPPLDRIARRAYIAGSLPNTPANLELWIRAPRGVNARTIMPDMNIPQKDARDIAAYLYTLD